MELHELNVPIAGSVMALTATVVAVRIIFSSGSSHMVHLLILTN